MPFYHYWGKTRRGETDGGDDYHLLCWHALDVAAMGYAMVQHNTFGIANYLKEAGITDSERAAQFFAWILCWHDCGKFAHSFQQLYSHENLLLQNDTSRKYENIPHTHLGFWLWNKHLSQYSELYPDSPLPEYKIRRMLTPWMAISTGHHGYPPESIQELNNFREKDIAAARDFLVMVKALFPLVAIPECWDEDESIERFNRLSWPVSAAIVLADWAGSSTRYFPRVASRMDPAVYWQQALGKAEQAVAALPKPSPVAEFSGIATLFPFIQQPTPLQQAVLELDIDKPGAQLFILEDVTGAGKTEAALILSHRLMAAGKAQGLYFGLPTMATANAIFDRLSKTWLAFYQQNARPSLILTHSARSLMARFIQSIWSGDWVGSEEPDEPQPFSQGCAAWFADSNKKALLADVGVGTLDQAMMAVMPFRHNNLRMLGLSNKIVLADEIHAYDAYMSLILEKLIERQALAGNTTILLSATLSQQQREKLVAAFARGTGKSVEAPMLGLDDYPWLTQVASEGIFSRHIASRKEVERSVSVQWEHSEPSCIERIEAAVRAGRCIAWIRNSVDDAIRIYRELRARGGVAPENLILFHSRFAFYDRQNIENLTLESFGKQSAAQRAGKVIISTQVIEQSLDIDVDEMISDLAPVDLLIQRAGRLQRHIRDTQGRVKTAGQDERAAPTLRIFAPEWDDSPPEEWLSSTMRNSAYIYPDHGRLWLTQRVLREQGEIRMPHSARLLIESVYGEAVEMPAALKKAEEQQLGKAYCDRAFAQQSVLNCLSAYGPGGNPFRPEKLSTRLAEESVTLWLAKIIDGVVSPYAPGEHGWEMSMLRVRQTWWNKHRSDFALLTGELFEQWCKAQRQNRDFATVIIVTEDERCGYSASEGLIGQVTE